MLRDGAFQIVKENGSSVAFPCIYMGLSEEDCPTALPNSIAWEIAELR